MTIDETIERYKAITNKNTICTIPCMTYCEKCVVEEHTQLVEWLEELKSLRKKQDVYNKAIDDFAEKVELKYLGVHPDELYEKYYPREICKQINELAEQLKDGVRE